MSTTTRALVLAAAAAVVGGLLVDPAAHAVGTSVSDTRPPISVIDQRTQETGSVAEPDEAASPWLLDGKDGTGPKDYPNAPGAKNSTGSKQAPPTSKQSPGGEQQRRTLPRVAG